MFGAGPAVRHAIGVAPIQVMWGSSMGDRPPCYVLTERPIRIVGFGFRPPCTPILTRTHRVRHNGSPSQVDVAACQGNERMEANADSDNIAFRVHEAAGRRATNVTISVTVCRPHH